MLILQEALASLELEIPKSYPCSRCGRETHPYGLQIKSGDQINIETEEVADAVCGHCILDEQRQDNAEAEQAEAERIAQEEPWNTPQAIEMKLERNRRIDRAHWAIDPLTSPLSAKTRGLYVAYIKALHRISVEFPTPDDVVWPDEPALEYE